MTVNRTEDGHMQTDPIRFPNGMKVVGDYIHSKGLKFGIYSSGGIKTCEHFAGSLDHEYIDAADWASWGVDYLKYDNCFNEDRPGQDRYPVMRDALNATGRNIVYAICSWGTDEIWEWGHNVGNSIRTTEDIWVGW